MRFWHGFWLYIHIMSAILGFGPTFAFAFIAIAGQKEPQHSLFASRLTHLISVRLVYPFAGMMAVSGIGLIVVSHIDFFSTGWLLAAVGIYVAAYAYSLLVQRVNAERMIGVLESMPPGPPPDAEGPPAELMVLGKRLQIGGVFLSLAVLTIAALMVWKPGT